MYAVIAFPGISLVRRNVAIGAEYCPLYYKYFVIIGPGPPGIFPTSPEIDGYFGFFFGWNTANFKNVQKWFRKSLFRPEGLQAIPYRRSLWGTHVKLNHTIAKTSRKTYIISGSSFLYISCFCLLTFFKCTNP